MRLAMISSIALLVCACRDERSPSTTGERDAGGSDAGELSPWPEATPRPASAAPPLTTCTPVPIPGLDAIAGFSQAAELWPIARNEIYVSLARGTPASMPSLARYDGTGWKGEELPAGLLARSVWGSPSGTTWATASPLETQTNGGMPPGVTVLRRANGVWEARPRIAHEGLRSGVITGVDDEHILVLASDDRQIFAFRSDGETWRELPATQSERRDLRLKGSWTLDARHIFAFSGGAIGTRGNLVAHLIMFDGTSGREIPIPIDLSDIVAMAGTSMDDLYVASSLKLFHVTSGLGTWTPIAFPSSLRIASLATRGDATYLLACDFPDPLAVSGTDDCSRFARLDGPRSITPGEVGATIGAGLAIATSRDGQELNLLTLRELSKGFVYRCE